MRIKITGINGYVGQLLSKQLEQQGYEVSGIQRHLLYGNLRDLIEEIRNCLVVINLAGASILQRWTKNNKRTIYDSRIQTSRNLVQAILELPAEERPKKFISASAIGIYKSGITHNEQSLNFDDGFVGEVVKDWENSLNELTQSASVTIFRIGLVLGKNSKSIKNLMLPFKLGLGGEIGTGQQGFPFIHEKDLVKAFIWAVENKANQRIYNAVAPEQISNYDFTKVFANKLNRPALFAVPSFLLKLILGKASSLLLKSPVVSPQNLLDAGFSFEYPTIDTALSEILE